MERIEPKPKNLIIIIGPLKSDDTIFKDIPKLIDDTIHSFIVSVLPAGQDATDISLRLKTMAITTDATHILVLQQQKEFNALEDIEKTINPLKHADIMIKYQPGQEEVFKLIGGRV